LTFTSQGEVIAMDIVVAYIGDIDVIVVHRSVGPNQPGAATTMGEKAVEKVKAGAAA